MARIVSEERAMIWKLLVGTLLTIAGGMAHADLRVFACEPEWAAVAARIGGDRVQVYQATTAHQDPHRIQARPSLIAQARRADLLICTGADLEAGWLPLLLRQARNPAIQPGQPGHLMAADWVPLQEIPERVDRAEGDVHAQGNPHIQTDPRNIGRVAAVVAERMALLDPNAGEQYRAAAAGFAADWQAAIAAWEQRAAPLHGMPIVVQHNSWVYLENWLGLERVATLEPKAGLPPASGHLATVSALLTERPARAIIRAAYQDDRASRWLAQRNDLPVVVLPFTVGGSDAAVDLFGLFDDTISRLLSAN
jgi:zinc/manganese transport system substrate-binding protein